MTFAATFFPFIYPRPRYLLFISIFLSTGFPRIAWKDLLQIFAFFCVSYSRKSNDRLAGEKNWAKKWRFQSCKMQFSSGKGQANRKLLNFKKICFPSDILSLPKGVIHAQHKQWFFLEFLGKFIIWKVRSDWSKKIVSQASLIEFFFALLSLSCFCFCPWSWLQDDKTQARMRTSILSVFYTIREDRKSRLWSIQNSICCLSSQRKKRKLQRYFSFWGLRHFLLYKRSKKRHF